MNHYNKHAGIDVVIPAYNHHKVIKRCLHSIAMQTIAEDITVIIVDDASDKPYDDIANEFRSDLKDIKIIRLDENSGPGTARRKGYEAGEGEFVTYIDADDTFASAYAIQQLHDTFVINRKLDAVFSIFLEETGNKEAPFVPHVRDCTWMFGKMYRRAYLEEFDILMNDTRSNEDMGYNQLVLSCSDFIGFIDVVTYYWHSSPESITRKSDNDYQFRGLHGYIQNHTWACEERKKRDMHKTEKGINSAIDALIMCYMYYIEVCQMRPTDQIKECLSWCQEFYDAGIRTLDDVINDGMLQRKYMDATKVHSQENGILTRVIPKITFPEFVNALKNKDAAIVYKN